MTSGQVIILAHKAPKPHIPHNLKSVTSLQDVHPEEIARQMCLIEHQIFSTIEPKECLKQKWAHGDKSKAPHVRDMINRFNQVWEKFHATKIF
jgi:hypothetical protein